MNFCIFFTHTSSLFHFVTPKLQASHCCAVWVPVRGEEFNNPWHFHLDQPSFWMPGESNHSQCSSWFLAKVIVLRERNVTVGLLTFFLSLWFTVLSSPGAWCDKDWPGPHILLPLTCYHHLHWSSARCFLPESPSQSLQGTLESQGYFQIRKEGPEKERNLPKVTQPMSARTRKKTWSLDSKVFHLLT